MENIHSVFDRYSTISSGVWRIWPVLVFSVFFAVVFCPFVAAVFALVLVLELFNIQHDRSLVVDDYGYCENVCPWLADRLG